MTHKWMLRVVPVAALALAAAFARGETVELRSGETVVGSVRLEGKDDVVIDAVYPSVEVVTVKRGDVSPESMHAILERLAGPADVAKRREMGEFAEEAGLLEVAVIDFTIVKKLDPSAAKDMDGRIKRLNEMIAGGVLLEAQELLDDGKPNAALMYLHALREKFPGTEAAKKADGVATAAHKAAGASAEVAVRTVPGTDAPRVADQVEAHAGKGAAEKAKIGGHVGSNVAAQRAAERSIVHYESAWDLAKTLPVTSSGDASLDARIERLRKSTKTSLVDAYLTAGTILLERRVIASAEKYCNLACELDPENKVNHRLHALIVQAKILGYRSGGSR